MRTRVPSVKSDLGPDGYLPFDPRRRNTRLLGPCGRPQRLCPESRSLSDDGFAAHKRHLNLCDTDPCDQSRSYDIGCAIGRAAVAVSQCEIRAGRSMATGARWASRRTHGAGRCAWVRVIGLTHVASAASAIRIAVLRDCCCRRRQCIACSAGSGRQCVSTISARHGIECGCVEYRDARTLRRTA